MLLKAEASRLTLGYFWWFIEPLLWVSIFYLVFNVILTSHSTGAEFVVFLATGKLAFIWYSKAVVQASNSIVANKGLVGCVNVPKSIFPVSTTHESLYRQSTVYALLVIIMLIFGYPPTLNWLWMIPVVAVYYLFIVACSLVGAYLVCLVRDFVKVIPLGMMFLMFTSGVFWDVQTIGSPQKIQIFFAINPLAWLLDAHRQVLMHGATPDLGYLCGIALVSIALITIMVMLMRCHSQKLAMKVLT